MTGHLFTNATLATLSSSREEPFGLIEAAAIAVQDGRIAWLGGMDAIPGDFGGAAREDLGGRLVTPALIDCHSHLIFGGDRAREFDMLLRGATYEEVARAGGGIVSTVRQTRRLNEEELVAAALSRLDALLAEGLGAIEIKSGYGLTVEDELKMLRAARRLGAQRNIRVKTTFLGAHALPADYADNGDGYLDEVCLPALRRGAGEGLIDAVDAFCEGIAFSPEQVARVFDCARDLNLPVKIHAEQLSNLGGAELAASYGALSADHLEYLDEDGVRALKDAGTVAVLLPGAFYTLRETQLPPVQTLRDAGVPIALATDCNPGSSPLTSLLLTMNMACTLFRLSPEEALAGVTRNGARALGLQDEIGTLDVGKAAEMAVWDVGHPAELSYRMGFNPLYKRINGGPA